MNPYDILLPELWERVVDKAENAQDWLWLTLFQASISFREVPAVGSTRALALFPLAFPHFCKYLRFQDLLALRLVSRRWTKTVNGQMDSASPKTLADFQSKYDFQDPSRLIAFLKRFYSHPRGNGSPIIGNSIMIDYTNCSMAGNMMQAKLLTSCVMAKFGAHLSALDFSDFTVGVTSWDNFAHRLRLCLQHAPRLSSLTITCNTFFEVDTDNNGKVVPFTQADASPLIISNLKSLSFTGLGRGSEGTTFVVGLQNAILRLCSRSSNSLRKVATRGIPDALLDFPNLESAILSINDEGCRSILSSASWPLVALSLSASSNCDTRSLFEYAERFKATLTSLVTCTNVTTSKQRSQFRADLPQLKYLRMSEILPFDAFANLSNLEVLCITAVITRPGGLTGFMRDVQAELTRSKIFQRLPNLRKVEMRGCKAGRAPGVLDPFQKFYSRENSNADCECNAHQRRRRK